MIHESIPPVHQDEEPAYRLPGIPAPLAYETDWERRLDEWHALRKVPLYEELATVRAGRAGELGLRDRLGRHECSRFGEIFVASECAGICATHELVGTRSTSSW